MFFFFKQKTAYEMRISDWSSDVCSSDLPRSGVRARQFCHHLRQKVHSDPNGTYFSHASESWHPAPFALAQPLEVTGFQLSLEWNDEIGRASCRERVCQ